MRIIIRFLLCALFLLAVSVSSFARTRVEIVITPPALPIYDQPICPGDGYIWTPGYWAWDDVDNDYYWVPGTWVLAPEVGFLWTPGYWAWGGEAFIFHAGYWGPVVGFYGGIDYGFGYFGHGFVGGRWEHDHFFYNREVSRVDVNVIHNVYNERVTKVAENRVSFNGGRGGVDSRPTHEEEAATREKHIGPVADQMKHVQEARGNPELRASANHGKPPVAATPRPGAFTDRAAISAKKAGGTYNPPNNRAEAGHAEEARRSENETRAPGNNAPSTAVHPRELPRAEPAAAPNTGNAKLDKKYQQQQEKLQARQEQQRQSLQQRQDQEHQRLQQQRASEAQRQQVEQKHQQQTQHLAQQHTQQQQSLQRKQQPARENAPRH